MRRASRATSADGVGNNRHRIDASTLVHRSSVQGWRRRHAATPIPARLRPDRATMFPPTRAAPNLVQIGIPSRRVPPSFHLALARSDGKSDRCFHIGGATVTSFRRWRAVIATAFRGQGICRRRARFRGGICNPPRANLPIGAGCF
jgi:hypothetical protein